MKPFIFFCVETNMRKFIILLKDFKGISSWGHSNWKRNYKVFSLIPALDFEWDTQCAPIVQDGEIVFEGCRDFTISIDFLWVSGGIVFEFNWTVRNPNDFEPVPPTESELKEIDEIFRKLQGEL